MGDDKKDKWIKQAGHCMRGLAKGILLEVFTPFLWEAKDSLVEVAQDSLRETIGGKLTFDEFAKAVIKEVDRTKLRVEREENLKYVGGTLKFSASQNIGLEDVTVSFQLYFLDEGKQWHRTSAESDVPAIKFTQDDIDELCSQGEIVFEVE